MMGRVLVKRGAAFAYLGKFSEAVKDFTSALTPEYKEVFLEEETRAMARDIEIVKVRQKSQDLKAQADKFIIESTNLDEALKLYEEASELDPYNEYAYSNMALVYLKKNNYEKCIEFSNKALEIVQTFMDDTRSFSKDNILECKLLQRRGKSFEMLNQLENAKKDLDMSVMLDSQNPEAKQ
jgi:tetratricopeptide (TPR) repeat protein